MVLSDIEITERCETDTPMIAPFFPQQVRRIKEDNQGSVIERSVISYGVSSYGYDIRLGGDVKLFHNLGSTIIDPKKLDHSRILTTLEEETDETGAKYIVIPGNSYILGPSMEHFHIPDDIQSIALAKSTYARAGVAINVTPLEAGWKGELVIEVANHAPLPVKVYLYEGICQLIFLKGNPCKTTYADRNGKYQNQRGVTLGRM